MKKLALLIVVYGLVSMLPGFATEPLEGMYDVQGWEPGGDHGSTPDYTGTLEIKKRGDGYVFEGTVDDERCQGVGYFGDDKASFNFAYRGAKGDAGLATGRDRNGIWVTYWISFDALDGRSGRELWRKLADPNGTGAALDTEHSSAGKSGP